MSRERRLQPVQPRAQRRADADQIREQARRLLRDEVRALLRTVSDRFPWMTAETAALYLDFRNCKDPVAAFRSWAKRAAQADPPLVCAHRGDVPLWHRDDLDAAINAANRRAARRAS